MAFLMLSELIAYFTVEITSEVGVDTSFGIKLPINFGIFNKINIINKKN